MNHPFVVAAIQAYASLLALALPVTFFIGASNMAINILFNAFFHGKLKIGGK